MNTDRIEDALKYDNHTIDKSPTPKPGMTGCMFSFSFLLHQTISHFFVEFLDILATEDGFRVSLSPAVEIEPLIMSSSMVAGVSDTRDTRPFKKRAVWNPHSFFDGSPPIRATRDGHMGCWTTRIPGSWKAYRCFHFIRDKQPVVRPRNSSLEKRQASSVIALVSSCNVSTFLQKLKTDLILLMIDFCSLFCSQPAPEKLKSVSVAAPLSKSKSSHIEEDDDSDGEDRLRSKVSCLSDSFSRFCFLSLVIVSIFSTSSGVIPFQDVHVRVPGPVPEPELYDSHHTS